MTNTIKAIETQYKGHRFRSRLEARWAVFFDTLGVKWEYEPEGYDLGKVGWYLPDFYFPEVRWHGEVKPDAPIAKSDIAKMEYFDNYPPKNSLGLIYIIGHPDILPEKIKLEELTPSQRITKTIAIRLNAYDHELIASAVTAFRSARFGGSDDTFDLEIEKAIASLRQHAKNVNGSWMINGERVECVSDFDVYKELLSPDRALQVLGDYSVNQSAEIHVANGKWEVLATESVRSTARHINITRSLTESNTSENPFNNEIPAWLGNK